VRPGDLTKLVVKPFASGIPGFITGWISRMVVFAFAFDDGMVDRGLGEAGVVGFWHWMCSKYGWWNSDRPRGCHNRMKRGSLT
jgi:hypothetical protein